jgi:hypothetical protein
MLAKQKWTKVKRGGSSWRFPLFLRYGKRILNIEVIFIFDFTACPV